MAFTEPIPNLNNAARGLFEKAYGDGNLLLLENLRLDQLILQSQQIFERDGSTDEFIEHSNSTRNEVLEFAQNKLESGVSSWNDYFRLLSRAEFSYQAACVPRLFSNRSYFKERSNLIDGSLGTNVEVLELAIGLFDSHNVSYKEMREMVGAINEQTALAMLNHSQAPSRLAIAPSAVDDIKHAIDIELWRIPKQIGYVQHVQVKSSPFRAALASAHHKDVIVVSANDLHNYGNDFATSRLLVKECTVGLDTDETSYLVQLCESLYAKIDSDPANHNGAVRQLTK